MERSDRLGSGHGSVLMQVDLETNFSMSMVQELDLILVIGPGKIETWL